MTSSSSSHRPSADPDPDTGLLAGKTIAVTASRRIEEQVAAFERQGARVLVAPTVRIVPVADDTELHAATDHILAHHPDILLVTTGYGLNGWFDSARARGLEEQLRQALAEATILVRGAKGRGAVRGLGFEDAGMAAQERTSALVDLALERGVAGQHVVVQQHGSPDAAQEARLVAAGARVTAVVPHRWEAPERPELVDDLLDAVVAGEVDAVTFTAAPAVTALFESASARGVLPQVVEAFKTGTIAAAVGPVTAEPLEEAGIAPLTPERFRLGALVKELTAALVD
ncbi:uroporphyrinogen-III synthase [Rothia nasisuis]|uniref:uroporphyrinogen-III synthase n=1 Tax=Rothia nasisuis TaxID=2109647 RepID=UPI001F015966|nr:uroporphyrinogen-III synthase [Rothia nasisuis]